MKAPSNDPDAPADPARRRLMTVLFIGVFMSALDTAVLAPAIPALRAAFALDNREVSLVMVVFVLFSLVATALMADLGDRHGRRPVYLWSVALFALGSLIIAVSPSYAGILVGRAIQGVGGGGIIPTASAVIGDAFPPAQRGRALGLIGAIYGMAFVLGPPLAALVMVALSWQWIFLANLPIAAAILWLGLRSLPAPAARSGPRAPLDVPGMLVVFVLLTALVLGVTRVADGVPGVPPWPVLLGIAAAGVALLWRIERKAAQPMIPVALFANRQLSTTYLLTAGAGFGMGAVIFLTSVATLAHGVDRAHGGFALIPMVVCSMVASAGGGRLLHRTGARAMIVAGFALLALGYAASAWTGGGLVGFLAASVPVGMGVGIVVGGALRTIAIDEAPVAQRGAAQGLVNIFTSVGTLFSAAAIGALADFAGGGAAGFSTAYLAVAAVMIVMTALALTLRSDRRMPAPAKRVH